MIIRCIVLSLLFFSSFSFALKFGDVDFPVEGYQQISFACDGNTLRLFTDHYNKNFERLKQTVQQGKLDHSPFFNNYMAPDSKGDEQYGNYTTLFLKEKSGKPRMLPVGAYDDGSIYVYEYEPAEAGVDGNELGRFKTVLNVSGPYNPGGKKPLGPSEQATIPTVNVMLLDHLYILRNGYLLVRHIQFNDDGQLVEIEADRQEIDLGDGYRKASGLAFNYGKLEDDSVELCLDITAGRPLWRQDSKPSVLQFLPNSDGSIDENKNKLRPQLVKIVKYLTELNVAYDKLSKNKSIEGDIARPTSNVLRFIHIGELENWTPQEAIVDQGFDPDVNFRIHHSNVACIHDSKKVGKSTVTLAGLGGKTIDVDTVELRGLAGEIPEFTLTHNKKAYFKQDETSKAIIYNVDSGFDLLLLSSTGLLMWPESGVKCYKEFCENSSLKNVAPKSFIATKSLAAFAMAYWNPKKAFGEVSYDPRVAQQADPNPEYEEMGFIHIDGYEISARFQADEIPASWMGQPVEGVRNMTDSAVLVPVF